MRTKLPEFMLSVSENDFDIIAIVESWLYPDILSSEFFCDQHYNVFRRDRCTDKFQKGGGVILAVHSRFQCAPINLVHQDVEQLCVLLMPSSKLNCKLYISLSYIPPCSALEVYEKHVLNVEDICTHHCNVEDTYILVVGDFNLPSITWTLDPDDMMLVPTNVSSTIEKIVIDSFLSNNLLQINNITNFFGKFLDLVFLSDDFDFSVNQVKFPLARNDLHHFPICITIKLYSFISPLVTDPQLEFKFLKADFSSLNELLNSVNWEVQLNGVDLNHIYSHFSAIIGNAISCHVPLAPKRSNSDPPWFTRSLKRLKNGRNKSFKLSKKFNSCISYKTRYHQLRREYEFLNRFLYKNYVLSLENALKSNSKLFWVHINKLRKSTGLPSYMSLDSHESFDLQTTVNLFAKFFSDVFNNPASYNNYDGNHIKPIVDIGCIQIGAIDIEGAIEALDNNHKADVDNICNLFIKSCRSSIVQPLLIIFNLSLRQGLFLDSWKVSSISPIFKAGPKHLIKNYRGIAKISVIPKLFEAIIKNKIMIRIKNQISPFQHGFMSGRSSSTNLVLFTNIVMKAIEDGYQVDTVFTDFSKAFDRVNISILIKKLSLYGFHSSMLSWIQSYLMNRWHFVRVDDCISDRFPALSGVPQGSHLGPLLFLIMINDFPSLLLHSHVLLYADDLKLFHIIKSPRDCAYLQVDVDILTDWCLSNGFELNIPKCSVMSFYRCKFPTVHNYSIGFQAISRSMSFKDLGIMVDTRLNFLLHLDYVISKSNMMLGFLKRNTNDFKDIGTFNSLYFSLVRSQIEYGSVVWSPNYQSHVDRIERIQRSYSRFVLFKYGFRNMPSYHSRCRLLGLESLGNRRKISCGVFVWDIISGRIDCPELLERVNISVPPRPLRFPTFLHVPFHRVNYGRFEPLTNGIIIFNSLFHLIDFNSSREYLIGRIRSVVYNGGIV